MHHAEAGILADAYFCYHISGCNLYLHTYSCNLQVATRLPTQNTL